MLFNSVQYLFFLPVVVLLYWFAGRRLRPIVLLVASYLFYMSWKASYGWLLFGMTAGNYVFGLLLARRRLAQSSKRLIFVAAVTLNLGFLALFKYTDFIIESVWQVFKGIESTTQVAATQGMPAPLLHITLPLAISFFVFEFIHYLSDVFKGAAPIRSPLRFALFAAFFPSQIAGPIKRYQDFDQQLVAKPSFDQFRFWQGLSLIVEGMFKKVVLGDNLATLVQPGFESAASLGTAEAWIAVAAFTLQIYYDFSGYTDIGRGSAKLLGFELPENFNMPYLARDLSDFWRRWHISLSTWLRDYLYIPLGGSRRGPSQTAVNLVITMFLGGLWHGAGWHYVLWGLLHGFGLVVAHSWQQFSAALPILRGSIATRVTGYVGWATTLVFVMVAWVLFRAESLPQALELYRSMFCPQAGSAGQPQLIQMFIESPLPIAFALYAAYHGARGLKDRFDLGRKKHDPDTRFSQPERHALVECAAGTVVSGRGPSVSNIVPRCVAMAAVSYLIVGLAPQKAIPFIYFRF